MTVALFVLALAAFVGCTVSLLTDGEMFLRSSNLTAKEQWLQFSLALFSLVIAALVSVVDARGWP